jgi:mono/diheme cytochrome c family protein
MVDWQDGKPTWGKAMALGVTIGAAGVLVLLGLVGLIVVYTGAYNVAATEEHVSFTRWAFDTTFHNSVERRADGVAPPEALTPEMIAAGSTKYKAMCQHCHAGPGVDRSSWASGMRPRPPHLAEAAAEWEPEEVFWIVKHGIKMSGMPAFGPSHDDTTIWGIVAFVKELPAMTPERYASLGEAPRQGGGDAGGAQSP